MSGTQALQRTETSPRKLTPQEEVQRQAAAACAATSTPDCQKTIHVGIFFDGTNNNRDRDKAEFTPSHSNVVVLYEAYKDKPSEGFYAYYVPGVGTKFIEIGEPTESDGGKAYGKGGDQRINWALIQVVNAIHRAVHDDKPLLSPYDAGVEAGIWPLHTEAAFDASRGNKRKFFCDGLNPDRDQVEYQRQKQAFCDDESTDAQARKSRISARQRKGNLTPAENEAIEQEIREIEQRLTALEKNKRNGEAFRPLLTRLTEALERKALPKIRLVNLSVFGFSRGAAQARAFCNMLQDIMTADGSRTIEKIRGKNNPGFALAGVPLRVQFLGLFDTVASSGLADASPTHRGFGGWANGTMNIASCVERSVHFVAGHELRHAFPASSARIGPSSYPKNCLEVLYPGAHSDVGGGYPSGSQGKALGGRTELLSQVPLIEMYTEARKSGVPLCSEDELKAAGNRGTVADLQVEGGTAKLFNTYARLAAPQPDVAERMLEKHVQAYWRWRLQRSADPAFKALSSYQAAAPQAAQDLWESENDFRLDHVRALKALAASRNGRGNAKPASQSDLDYEQVRLRGTVPPEVDEFFDKLVHDSHATFYMVGPTTDLDRRELKEALAGRDAASLNGVEKRILYSKDFPVLTDADTPELLNTMKWYFRWALKYGASQTTRRETGGHIHYRRIFDAS